MPNLNPLPYWLIDSQSNDYKSIYEQLGWKLIPIPTGSKAPTHREWNKQENCKLPDNWQGNIGLALAYSNIVSIDIDNWLKATKWLKDNSISLDALYHAADTIKFESGKEGSAKLLYRLPEGIQPLESKQIHMKTPEGMNECVLELRCATRDGLTVQDVLPPSIHPETQQPYKWVKSDELSLHDYLANMPELPNELLKLWQSLITPANSPKPVSTITLTDELLHDVEDALKHISPDTSRDEWIKVGMALHHLDSGSTLFALWDNWSSQSQSKYPGTKELQIQWQSFKPDKNNSITINSLFHAARENGYTKDISQHFDTVSQNVNNKGTADWREKYMLTEQQINELEETKWIYENLIPSSHIVTIVAEPNAGKTTICFHIACELAQQGYTITYVNADISGGDIKYYQQRAGKSGVALLLPDMVVGCSMEDVVKDLTALNKSDDELSEQIFFFDTLKKMTALNKSDDELSEQIFFFDTLKKMTDVINKQKTKGLMQTLRGLSAKGATIVLLAHTNKYKDDEGKPIYEGTGDIKSDSDELIYFIPVKNSDGSITVSTEVSKQRKQTKPITFNISPDRIVTRTDSYINTRDIATAKKEYQKDKEIIDTIKTALSIGIGQQNEIFNYCKNEGLTRRKVERVLKKYTQGGSISLWQTKRGDNNALIYTLLNNNNLQQYFNEE